MQKKIVHPNIELTDLNQVHPTAAPFAISRKSCMNI